ncbi:hypothetical protein NEF87_001844 [Candidatus Lokiarchaeum ossiferum]|uniref:SAM-dependent chlorinase/fluorinase n=1 Tax=Candidatus Lokiarchaeum ossiferum TaxID=2951803 RepID=A0ABY6HSL4_9ARCH|nr:hypothetical protein NEF87_001844 [Candidatus Lokiarchaeum sp. B-35]
MTIIGILTDFGMRGQHYVAEMKGVALKINQNVRFIDVSHTITPFSIMEAAYTLYTVYDTFPAESIFVCVIDPGVGSDRDIVAIQTIDNYILIGPDNGIFSYFAQKNLISMIIKITEPDFYNPRYAEALKIVEKRQEFQKDVYTQDQGINPLENSNRLKIDSDEIPRSIPDTTSIAPTQLTPITSTFHGRDIMMPVGAHLSNGLDLFSIGEPKDELDVILNIEPEISEDKQFITAKIQYIDDFGNIITTIPIVEFQMFTFNKKCSYHLHHREKNHPIIATPTFAGHDSDQLLLIEGSSGFLEICCNKARADEVIDAALEDSFKLEIMGALFSEFTEFPFSQ